MDVLGARLEALERSVCGEEPRQGSETLVAQVALVERQLSRTLSTHASLALALEKYDKLRDVIEGDGDLELRRRLLGVHSKTELVLMNEAAMKTLSEMRTIRDLQGRINQPEYTAAAELLPRMRALGEQYGGQVTEFRNVVDEVSDIVDRYHSETEALSELFIRWDHALTGIERKVAELEAAHRR
ncbi:hypothetical protein GGF46_003682 [Coemansia sp. RSA 552]|nr:hypothetical protein GGF46_003682 [Coemansia sp. RSA 552]